FHIIILANGSVQFFGFTSPEQSLSFDLFQSKADWGSRASLPAMEGPHASRLWVRLMKNLTMPAYPLN
ncbi:hypothetical protein ACFL6S_09405, partial [Candidatus Poribacteria bacterium]